MSTIFFRLSSLHWSFCALSSSSSVVVCSFYLSLSFFYPFPTVSFSPPFSPFFCPFFPFSFLSLSLFDLFTSFFHFSNFFHLSLLFLLTFLSFFFYPFFSVLSFFSLFLIFFSFLSYFFDTFLTLVFQFVTPFYFSACFSFLSFLFSFSHSLYGKDVAREGEHLHNEKFLASRDAKCSSLAAAKKSENLNNCRWAKEKKRRRGCGRRDMVQCWVCFCLWMDAVKLSSTTEKRLRNCKPGLEKKTGSNRRRSC